MEFVIFVNTKLFCQEETFSQDNLYYSQNFINGAQQKIQQKLNLFKSQKETADDENSPISIIDFQDKTSISQDEEQLDAKITLQGPNLLDANNLLNSNKTGFLVQQNKEFLKYEFLMTQIDQEVKLFNIQTFENHKEICLNIYNYAYKQHWIENTLRLVLNLGGCQRIFIFILNKLKIIVIEELIGILHTQSNESFKKLQKKQQHLLQKEKNNLDYDLDLLNNEKQEWQNDLKEMYTKIQDKINLQQTSFEDVRIQFRFALAYLYKQCGNTLDQTQVIESFTKLRLYLLGCMLLNTLFTTYRKITFQQFDIDDVSEIENFITTKPTEEISQLIDHIQKLHFGKWK